MPETACVLPPELKACAERFEMWYKQKNSNRKMTWLYGNGTVEMACLQAKKKHQLVINVFQASILSLFNQHDELTCRQIVEATRMPMDSFKQAMMQMCNPKVKLLLK